MDLAPEDFSLDSHQRIYKAILQLIEAGHAVDYLTVSEALQKKRELDSVGGREYLAELGERLPRKLSIESYVRIIRDKSLLRELMNVCDGGMIEAADQSTEALDVLNNVSNRLMEISDRAIVRSFSGIREIVKESFGSIDQLYEQGREITGLATHYTDFDRMTSGLQESELIIIAARPSMGKTAWAINIAQNAAVHDGNVVAVFSLEMSKESLLRRHAGKRGAGEFAETANGIDAEEDRGKLRSARAADGFEDVYRRHAGDYAGGDAGEGAAAEAAGRAAGPDCGGLFAVDDGIEFDGEEGI